MKRDTKTVEEISYQLYQNRIAKGIEGSAEMDWQEAQRVVQKLKNRKNPWRRLINWWETTPTEKGLETLVRDLQNLAIFDLLALLANVAIIVSLGAFLTGGEQQRRNTEVYEAWQVITAAYGQTGSGGRIKALEFLNSSPRVPGRRRWWGGVWSAESLAGVDVSKAYLAGIQLPNASLQEANLNNANLEIANLDEASLTKANLQDANLRSSNLGNADLSNANLRSAILYEANLQNANLIGANLQSAGLANANLQGADLSFSRTPITWIGRIPRVKWNTKPYKGANLQEADLDKAILQEANLESVNLEAADLVSANLQSSSLADAILRETFLLQADLSGSNLQSVDFSGADLRDASLDGAILLNANLSKAVNFEVQQIEGDAPPLLCATQLPPEFNIDPNRDCERLLAVLLERYPDDFSTIDEVREYMDCVLNPNEDFLPFRVSCK